MSQHQLAVLFADLAGSTATYERLGDVAAKKLVDTCLLRMAQTSRQHDGQVIKTIGDELMLRFPNAAKAGAAAVAMQRGNRESQSPFHLRIGFHHGPVIVEAADVFGDAVNTAARLSQMARDGQILTSEESLQHLGPELQGIARPFDYDRLRGKTQATRIFELLWEQTREVTRLVDRGNTTVGHTPDVARNIRLAVRSQERSFAAQDAPVTVGREQVCAFTVASEFASRVHAHVEYRRGKFVLQDRSTNGTFVTPEGGSEIFLKGESLPLSGRGIISLGCPLLSQTGDVLRYTVENS